MRDILFAFCLFTTFAATAQQKFELSDIEGNWLATTRIDKKTGKQVALKEDKFGYNFTNTTLEGNPIAYIKTGSTEIKCIYTIVNDKVFLSHAKNTNWIMERLQVVKLIKGKQMTLQKTVYVDDEKIDFGKYVLVKLDDED